MTIKVLRYGEKYPFIDIVVHEESIPLRLEEAQELHIVLGQDCKEVGCPCYGRGRIDGELFIIEHTGPAMKGDS